jgi:hypothetical protein
MSFTAPTTKLPMAWNTPDSQLWDGAIPAAPDTAERARPRSESNWSRIWKPRPSSPETSPARLPTLLEALETAVCASTTAGVVEEAWGRPGGGAEVALGRREVALRGGQVPPRGGQLLGQRAELALQRAELALVDVEGLGDLSV